MKPTKSVAGAVVALLVLGGPTLAKMPTSVGEGEGIVDIVAWPGYIERGETDKNYNWVTDFEKKTGCRVNVKTAATSDEMVRLMNQGGFDLVTASGDASLRLIAGKKVQPINIDLIPSWKTVDERLQNAPWHTVDGLHYGVPYQWGPNVLAYNTDVFKGAPKSWSVVFEEQTLPDGKSNKGRVQAYDAPIYIADAAVFLMTKKPELGIKNPYELTPDQYAAVIALLQAQRPLIGRYWHDAMVQVDDFKNKDVVASSSWAFQVTLLQGDNKPIASIVPVEGATGWADTTMMHAEAMHPNCAYKWLEHSLSPKLQGDLAAWFGSVPAVPAACKGNALLTDAGCTNNGFDNFEKIWFWRSPGAKCEAEGTCVPYSKWAKDYVAVREGNAVEPIVQARAETSPFVIPKNATAEEQPPKENAEETPSAAPTAASNTAPATVLGKRVALVIGNSNYSNIGRLDNPANDARLMAAALKEDGFTLVGGGPQLDLDKAGFDRAVQTFGNSLQGADVGLFYYAGHGVQVRGDNYLIPVDANPTRESDADFQMLNANLVLRQMEEAGTRLNLVMLDACRNNPLAGRGLRGAAGGLAQMQAPEGTVISFATEPGTVAQDGFDGNSPYTKALAEAIRTPSLGIFDTFNQVGLKVKKATGGAQKPWQSSSPIEGVFFFKPAS